MSKAQKRCMSCVRGGVVQWSKWMEMEEGCIFEVMLLMKGSGKQEEEEEKEKKGRRQKSGCDIARDRQQQQGRERGRRAREETENLELEHYAGGDGLAEKGGEESGWNENSGEKRFEKVDMRQVKEKMGDCMNIVVENLVFLPKEDREKVLSQYYSARNQFERFRGFLELIRRFEFEFRRRGNYIF